MKKLIFMLACAFAATPKLTAQVLITELLNYGSTTQALTTASGGIWVSHSGTAGSLSYDGSQSLSMATYRCGAATGGAISFSAALTEDANTAFAAQTSGKTYGAFLLRLTTGSTTGNYFAHFMNGPSSLLCRVGAKIDGSNNVAFTFAKSTGTILSTPFSFALNTTYLVVVKLEVVSGATNDIGSLFVLSTYQATEPGTPTLSATDGTDIAPAAFAVRQSTNMGTGLIDGISVAKTWSEALPIELLGFSARAGEKNSLLSWQTASETQTAHFDIQRSPDAQTWQSIGEVKATGESHETKTYTFTDENPLPVSYYRLRSVDFDGAAQFSNIERVARGSSTKAPYILPTNVADETTVVFESETEKEATIAIFDLTGRQVFNQTIAVEKGENRLPLNLGTLPTGAYSLQILGENAVPARFVKI